MESTLKVRSGKEVPKIPLGLHEISADVFDKSSETLVKPQVIPPLQERNETGKKGKGKEK